MPYSDDLNRLEEMLPYIQTLSSGENVRWPIKRGNANTVAFRIRESLRLVLMHKLQYPELAEYAGDYKIRVVDQFTVEAVRRTPKRAEPTSAEVVVRNLVEAEPIEQKATLRKQVVVQEIEDAAVIRSIPTESILDSRADTLRNLLGKQTPISIAEAYRRYGRVKPTLHFPDANMDDEELTELFRWAAVHVPNLMLMVDGPAVTVSILDPMVAEYSWRPPEGMLDELS